MADTKYKHTSLKRMFQTYGKKFLDNPEKFLKQGEQQYSLDYIRQLKNRIKNKKWYIQYVTDKLQKDIEKTLQLERNSVADFIYNTSKKTKKK